MPIDNQPPLREVFEDIRAKQVPTGAPVFDPETYKGPQYNCYSYALRLRDHGWATPGQLTHINSSNISEGSINQTEIHFRMMSDGLIPIKPEEIGKDEHIIAAYVMPGHDYHFYSLDSDGTWSSKNGAGLIKKTDSIPINDGRDGDYNSGFLIGFYKVPKEGVSYYPRLKIIRDLQSLGLDLG